MRRAANAQVNGGGNGAHAAPAVHARPEVLHLTPETVTQATLEQMATTPDPRMKEIMEAAVKHLHQFARDVKLTPAEWLIGIDFLTRVGKMCTPDRQEFILLSDTTGLSALVNLMHDKTAIEVGTDTSLLGPFFRENAPHMQPGSQIAKDTSAGEVAMYGRVTDVDGKPLANARIDIWQTASSGLYDIQSDPSGAMDCRGYFTTDASGNYLMRTVAPDRLLDPDGRSRRRDGQGAAAARHAARAHPPADQCARASRARHRALPVDQQVSGDRRRVRLLLRGPRRPGRRQ